MKSENKQRVLFERKPGRQACYLILHKECFQSSDPGTWTKTTRPGLVPRKLWPGKAMEQIDNSLTQAQSSSHETKCIYRE